MPALAGVRQRDRQRGRGGVAVAVDAVDHALAIDCRAARRRPRGCGRWPGGRRTGRCRRARARRARRPRRVDSDRRCTAALKVSWPCMRMICSSCVARIAAARRRRRRAGRCGRSGPGRRRRRRPPPRPAPSANSAAVPRSDVIREAAQHVGADHQHVLAAPALDLGGGQRERGQEAGAGGADVHRAGAVRRRGRARPAARRWASARRRPRRDEHEVDVGGRQPGLARARCAARRRRRGPAGARLRATWRRSCTPVRCTIHCSVTPAPSATVAFETTWSGTAIASETIAAGRVARSSAGAALDDGATHLRPPSPAAPRPPRRRATCARGS